MEVRVKMESNDSKALEDLYVNYVSHCNILGYLSQYGSVEDERFDKRWEDTVKISIELEKLKSKMDNKYRPRDKEYKNYFVDFETEEMVYTL